MVLITIEKENGDNSSFSNGKGGGQYICSWKLHNDFYKVLALNKARVNKQTNLCSKRTNVCIIQGEC